MARTTTLALLALVVTLSGCGARSPGESAADSRTLAREGLSLQLPPGWSGFTDDLGAYDPNPVVWAANVPLEPATNAWPRTTLESLPAGGIALFVAASRAPTSDPEPVLTAPIELAEGHFIPTGYEGQPAPNVSFATVTGRLGDRSLSVQAWFGANQPSQAMLAEVDRVLATVEIGPEPPPGSEAGWRTYRDETAKLNLRYPPRWQVAGKALMPLLTEPRELVSLGTSSLRPGSERCPHIPANAIDDLGPKDALISLLEYRSGGKAQARTKHLLPYAGNPFGTDCLGRSLPPRFLYRTQDFEDSGRTFQLYVAIGESASNATRRQTAEILDSLKIGAATAAASPGS